MKRVLTLLFCAALIAFTYLNFNELLNYTDKYIYNKKKVKYVDKNEYSKSGNFKFINISKDFTPYNYQDLLNIFYTILDSGYETYTFYCPSEYLDCIKDVEKISDKSNVEVLTTLGNFVSTFNNFSSIKVSYDTAGEVTIKVKHIYDENDKKIINNKIDEIWNSIVTADMSNEDIIYAFHDYIINNTKYDEAFENELKTGKTTHQSSKANGVLFEGFAICSGYTDTMAIILDRLNIPNFKVSSNTHVWNALYLNNRWLHLDLTWDDPVSKNSNEDTLLHKFFLIDTKTLEEFDIKDHTFNKSIYLELK